jgi:hypothetical protein
MGDGGGGLGTSAHAAAGRASPASTRWIHLGLVVALSAAYESVFIHHGLNAMDEGWPLYAAMQLHAGGRLYDDVFFVFPPGHLFAAWIAYALDPPGVVLVRILYAAFTVALCAALYGLGRRITTPGFALLGAALVAVAAPDSHAAHLVFGYRYLAWSALALWCFSERLRTGDRRWMMAAGALTGVALVFRIDPPVAAAAGIAAGVLSLRPGWRDFARDAAAGAAGFAVVVLPVLGWLLASVGAETLWREVVIKPIEMTRLQDLPLPALDLPERWNTWTTRRWFVAVQFRLWLLLYAAYAVALAAMLVRTFVRGRRFEHPVLLAVFVWGALFYTRAFGRSDEPHLDSALPPALLLLAHAAGAGASRLRGWAPRAALAAAIFAAWVWVTAVLWYPVMLPRGAAPVQALGGATLVKPRTMWGRFDELVEAIRRETGPDDVILDLSASPLLHVATGRRGPGLFDLIMPGTFLSEAEELAFLERLERAPPALVIASRRPFDGTVERGLAASAPRVLAWVRRHYLPREEVGRFLLLAPRDEPREPGRVAP